MLQEPSGARRLTVAGDKGYDSAGFVAGCRELNVTPHIAQNESGAAEYSPLGPKCKSHNQGD